MPTVEVPAWPRDNQEGVRVFAFTVGWITLPLSFFLRGEDGQIRVPVPAYLIDHPKGFSLFDTGLGPRFEKRDGIMLNSRVEIDGESNIVARLEAIGVDPADIRWIINSHLHTDHAGGNRFFPNATIIVQAAEHAHAFATDEGGYHKPEFDLGQSFMRLNGEHDLHGDGTVLLFPTLGHTPGHQSVRVRLATGDIVLAADCCNVKRSLDDLHLPDHCHDADLFLDTLKRLRGLRERGTRIFYGHDPAFWSSVPQAVSAGPVW